MEEQGRRPITTQKIIAYITVVIAASIIGTVLIWHAHKPSSLFPSVIEKQITHFTPYFYRKQIPAGYSLDMAHVSYDNGVAFLPLTKAGSPTIVLTEQEMPAKLTQRQLQQGGSSVKDTASPATINKVEGRLVGVMVASGHKTLILLNAPGATQQDDLSLLLQGLQPIQ